jgi:hypothetical protein
MPHWPLRQRALRSLITDENTTTDLQALMNNGYPTSAKPAWVKACRCRCNDEELRSGSLHGADE